MCVLKLIPLFSIVLVLGGLALPSNYAYAWCCGCKCMPTICYCMGTGNCPNLKCHTDDSPSLQAQTVINNEKFDILGSYASSPFPTMRSYSIDRLIARASSDQCDKSNFALKFFNTAEDRLKFEPDFLKYNASQDNEILASQISVNEEK
jgi:hypothetical protein